MDFNAKHRETLVNDFGIFKEFLEKYESRTRGEGRFKYKAQLQKIADREQTTLIVHLDDLAEYDADLATRTRENTARYAKLFADAVDESLPPRSNDFDADSADALDIFMEQRILLRSNNDPGLDPRKSYPRELLRRFEVVVQHGNSEKQLAIRNITAKDIGQLVRIRGIVTRMTEVKPLITVATYTCDRCDSEVYQQVKQGSFMPLQMCISATCTRNNTSGSLFMQTRGSKFIKFQEIKIQELADQVPVGHIPRTMTIHVRGELTRQAAPGDIIVVDGIFLPTPYVGFQAMRAGLLSDTYLDAQYIQRTKKNYEFQEALTPETIQQISKVGESQNVYERLAYSISPEIFGQFDVKKALLLLLVGGVTRELSDGMKIRGDINICLMGDPGVAKSQLLRFISNVSPRGVYTTGKGSSGVGLTAAVTRDTFTGELVLEGGALVLADKGVCCIDEFDKMDESDRASIHEVMEQQTISIAKAGITTTLNARASVLAAANPAFGRYNPQRSVSANINLPASLLSRFDLLFLLLDRPNVDDDLRLAQHITYVHQNSTHPPLDFEPLDAKFLRSYIAIARSHNPIIPPELTDYIVGVYVGMRTEEGHDNAKGAPISAYTSARTLLAILRLSTALARLRFSDTVIQEDIDEAFRLMLASKLTEEPEGEKLKMHPVDEVYSLIKDMNRSGARRSGINYEEAKQAILRQGFSQAQFEESLAQYAEISVLQVDANRSTIILLQ